MSMVYGQLPSSINPTELPEDGILVLLFEGEVPPVEVAHLAPEHTYIISNYAGGSDTLKQYLDAGFFNILSDTAYSTLTATLISNFMKSHYQVNKATHYGKQLVELYQNKKNLIDAMFAILIAIRNRDPLALQQVVKHNLNAAISEFSALTNAVELQKQAGDPRELIRALEERVLNLEAEKQAATPEMLEAANLSVQELQNKLSQRSQELQICQEDIASLNAQVTALTVSSSGTVPLATYEQLLADKESCGAELAAARQQVGNLQTQLATANANSQNAIPTDAFGQAQLIESLRKEIELARGVSLPERLFGMLPLFTDGLVVKTPYILQFKEIKTAIYMNSLVNWLVLLLKSAMVRGKNQNPLILIFDPLTDQFRVKKYEKHQFAINAAPTAPNFVVVTDDCNLLFLKDVLRVQNYDFLIVIDRFGISRPVAKSDKTITYNLIDSPSDITDFGLDPQACVAFYQQDGVCRYHTPPNPAVAATLGRSRSSYIGQCGWVDEILKGLGILESK